MKSKPKCHLCIFDPLQRNEYLDYSVNLEGPCCTPAQLMRVQIEGECLVSFHMYYNETDRVRVFKLGEETTDDEI